MEIHLPGIYVNRIVKATTPKEIEIETLAPEPGNDDKEKASLGTGDARAKREQIVKVSPGCLRSRLKNPDRLSRSCLLDVSTDLVICLIQFDLLASGLGVAGRILRQPRDRDAHPDPQLFARGKERLVTVRERDLGDGSAAHESSDGC